ncbi:MAG: c-type cytochrome [Acidiferrobacteraceae bacterium]
MKKTILASALAGSLILTVALPAGAMMKMNPAVAHKALAEAAHRGAYLFGHDTFGGHRRMHGVPVTCETCHLGGGRVAGRLPNGARIPSLVNAAAIFPRYNPMAHGVVTLAMQIQHCIKGGLGGQPPALGSKTMVDMVAYLHTLAKGQPVDAGGMPK